MRTPERPAQTFELWIRKANLDAILSGKKTIELRYTTELQDVTTGDTIVFRDSSRGPYECTVLDARIYSNLDDVLAHENIDNIAPHIPQDRREALGRQIFSSPGNLVAVDIELIENQ